MSLVYLSLGSNMGPSERIITSAFENIAATAQVTLLRTSSLYRTSPVSPIPQADFVNAVCALETTLTPEALYAALHQIEQRLGKIPKHKNAPRTIDIDILFFGGESYQTPTLCIPHPKWQERLFVLLPLSEIAEEISFQGAAINLKNYLRNFSNPNNERVFTIPS